MTRTTFLGQVFFPTPVTLLHVHLLATPSNISEPHKMNAKMIYGTAWYAPFALVYEADLTGFHAGKRSVPQRWSLLQLFRGSEPLTLVR